MTATPLLALEDVRRHYHARGAGGELKAVDGVSFELAVGESVGLVGESGCGKSTLARLLMGLDRVTGGEIRFDGAVLDPTDRKHLTEVRKQMQIVFQDPYSSLNPRFTTGHTLAEVLKVRGMSDRAARRRRIDELLELVGLGADFASRRPRELSGGQRQRVVIARALAVEPRLLIADEAVSALDVSVQAQILNLLAKLQDDLGLTYVFISHDLDVVRHLCDRVLVMYLGRIVESGPVDRVFDDPGHPYTRALLDSIPSLDPSDRAHHMIGIRGDMPNPIDPPSGCHFHPRCALAVDRCRSESPALLPDRDGLAACFFAGKSGEDQAVGA